MAVEMKGGRERRRGAQKETEEEPSIYWGEEPKNNTMERVGRPYLLKSAASRIPTLPTNIFKHNIKGVTAKIENEVFSYMLFS